jgi:hypothetical protein
MSELVGRGRMEEAGGGGASYRDRSRSRDRVEPLKKNLALIYPGSYSPVSGAHQEVFSKFIDWGKNKGYEYVTIYVIPGNHFYVKDSVTKGKGSPTYLTEQVRKNFLQKAADLVNAKQTGKGAVVISDLEFKYGRGEIVEGKKEQALSVGELVENCDTWLGINPAITDKMLVLGGDNADEQYPGWAKPGEALIFIKHIVVSRGTRKTEAEKADIMIPCYYLPKNDGAYIKKRYADVIEERNRMYRALGGKFSGFDMTSEMEKMERVVFTVPEISSSLIRKIIGIDTSGLSVEDIDMIIKIMTQLKSNNPELPTINNAGDIETHKAAIITAFSPIPLEDLIEGYRISAIDDATPAPMAIGGKSRRRQRNSKKNKNKRKSRKNKRSKKH